jgi:hypothetical protein
MGALPPNPRDLTHCRQDWMAQREASCARPRRIPASESALGSRPRGALPSAQVQPV